jgi:hypothetical protein
MKVQKFLEWTDYGSHPGFGEQFESVILELEERMVKEGMHLGGGNPDLFVEDLQDLEVYGKFEDDLEKAASDWYENLYHQGYDEEWGEPNVTPEYIRVEKEVDSMIAKPGENTKATKRTPYNERKRLLSDALLRNSIEKHWKEWKAIYQKWIDYIHDHRGTITGKKYGL